MHFIMMKGEDKCYAGEPTDPIWTDQFEAKLFLSIDEVSIEGWELHKKGVWDELRMVEGPSAADIYLKYVDLVRYIAHRMKMSQYVEDAESFLGVLILTRWHSYDVRVCRRTTWIGRKISGHLLDLKMKDAKTAARHRSFPQLTIKDSHIRFLDLSIESQIILEMIRDDPEACRKMFSRSNRKEKFVRYIVDRGWSKDIVDRVLQELEEMVS